MPHQGDWRAAGVVAEGIRFNVPLRVVPKSQPPVSRSFFSVDQPNLILDTVKCSDSYTGAVVLRLYESIGARGVAQVTVPANFRSARVVDLLEENGTETKLLDGVLVLPFRPFQIITVQLR
jgi:alpha-mannosidase